MRTKGGEQISPILFFNYFIGENMNKFIGKKTTKTPKKQALKTTKTPKKPDVEVIKKGDQEFVTCPKCGWLHKFGTQKCRFCGSKL